MQRPRQLKANKRRYSVLPLSLGVAAIVGISVTCLAEVRTQNLSDFPVHALSGSGRQDLAHRGGKSTVARGNVVGREARAGDTATLADPSLPKLKDACQLVGSNGKPVRPMSFAAAGPDLYFLGPDCIWQALGAARNLSDPGPIIVNKIGFAKSGRAPNFQEFNSFRYLPARKSLIILDKSGDLFEYLPKTNAFALFRGNPASSGSPDPDFVELCTMGDAVVCLLDPERNQIWRITKPGLAMERFFPEVLPWRLRKGDANVSDGISIASDKDVYVLKAGPSITRYSGDGKKFQQHGVAFHQFPRMRPSRLVTAEGSPLFLVERENNRIVAIDKRTSTATQYLFEPNSDIRTVLPWKDGFWTLNGQLLVYRRLDSADPSNKSHHTRRIDSRLDGMAVPIQGGRLPHHPGVFPGARRQYRFGVHKGLDFFNDQCGVKIITGTPVLAADGGKVIRVDKNFTDMNATTFARVMSQCYQEHRTSEKNEDLFRGCQVWIDHGNGLVTRYAHLSKINTKLAPNSFVKRGDVIGFVGYSGTGQNLPGRAKFPHLHFEIWLDGKYLGWGLTPSETVGVYEDIFGPGK